MKRNIWIGTALSIGIALCMMLGVIRTDIGTEEKLTEDEAFDVLLQYIYDDYEMISYTKYEDYQEGEASHIYVGYPAYEFVLPGEELPITRQIICSGESSDKEYFIFSFFSWNYSVLPNGDFKEYINANFFSDFAVNKRTKEVVQRRAEDAGGLWVENREFPEWEMVTWE